MQDWPGLIEGYRRWLPVSDKTPVITLREGATPLIPAPSIAERSVRSQGLSENDGLNPTGSFKDRGMTWPSGGSRLRSGDLRQHRQHFRRRSGLCPPRGHARLCLDPRRLRCQGKLAQALLYGAEV